MDTYKKPGPRRQYGERQDVRLLLPVELMNYIDSVTTNRTKWLIEAAQEKRQREEEEIMATATTFSTILEKYLASPDFRDGVIASTQAGFDGSGYSVELFPDATWRNLWDKNVGNRYESQGVILSLPALNDTDDMQQYIDDGAGDEESFLKDVFEIEHVEIAQRLRENLKEAFRR